MKYLRRTCALLKEMNEYIDPMSNIDVFLDWLQNEIVFKSPDLMLDTRKGNGGIVYIRNKNSGQIVSKFKITVLDSVDDDLKFAEDEEESNSITDEIGNLTKVAQDDNLKNLGMGDLSDKAKGALDMFKQATMASIEKTSQVAKEILDRNQNNGGI